MQKNISELVFVLDCSGSMFGFEKDVIGSFNAMIARERETCSDALVTVILFSNHCELLYDRAPLQSVAFMTSNEYRLQGCSSILDGIGTAICKFKQICRTFPHDKKLGHVLFVIMTDGYENSSAMFSLEEIRDMIHESQEKFHWEFLFLGANIDAISIAAKLRSTIPQDAQPLLSQENSSREYDALGNVIRHPVRSNSSQA